MVNEQATEAFKKLLQLADRLLGPEGCAWDRKQTLHSLRESLLEESYEVIEAIDLNDDKNLVEELGDLFYNLILLSKIAENAKRFEVKDTLEAIGHKLVQRHPHVFGNVTLTDPDAIVAQWQELKKKEKKERTSCFDGIPKYLPSLARAYELASKAKCKAEACFASEEQLGQALWSLVKEGTASGLNAELALRKYLMQVEETLRVEEKSKK